MQNAVGSESKREMEVPLVSEPVILSETASANVDKSGAEHAKASAAPQVGSGAKLTDLFWREGERTVISILSVEGLQLRRQNQRC